MTISTLVAHLRTRQVELWLDDGQLRYRAPKSALCAELLSTLKDKKIDLIDYIGKFGPVRASGDLIDEVEPADSYPLSVDQEALWFLDQLRDGSPSDHLCRAFRLDGIVDADALESAFRQLVVRHDVLRTVFCDTPSGPVQTVLPILEWTLERIDLRSMTLESGLDEARSRCSEKTRERIDLIDGPLFKAVLFALSGDSHVLLLVMHHIVGDGHAFTLFSEELGELYDAYREGRSTWLPAPLRQYKDFLAYRRQQVGMEDTESDIGFWRDKLEDFSQSVELPLDRQRPAIQSSAGARVFFEISAVQCQALRTLGQKQGATLFMTVLAAFFALLKRYTSQSDLIVGAPVSLRDRAELETMLGLCLNMTVFAVDASDDLTFNDLLQRVRVSTIEAFSHQKLPFQQLVSAVRPSRDLSRNQVFQIMFQMSSLGSLRLGGREARPFDFDPGTAQLDLSIHLFEHAGSLRGFVEYDNELFDADRMVRMVDHLKTVLAAVVDDANQQIQQLQIMPELERSRVHHMWNDTAAPYRQDRCIHQLIEDQAAFAPDNLAVTFDGNQITYGTLNERADRLARKLHALGVTVDGFVGINMTRSIDMVAALLAVQKAGAAYLPLDPSFPPDRLSYMLEDSGTKVVLTNLPVEARVAGADVELIDLNQPDAWLTEVGPVSDRPSSSSDLAYMLYTSGSTGRPKGVQIEHRSVVNFLETMAREPGLSADDRLLSVTTLSFDISVLEIFLPLSVGAELVLASQEMISDGELLKDYMAKIRPSVMQATPSTWRMLLDCAWRDETDLKKLCGGEAMPLSLAKTLSSFPGELWNMYGPTETTIWSSVRRIEKADDEVLIGGPIANTQFYVVDSNLQSTPIGIPGELLIGGDGLARGYFNRPELTAERFITNPFGSTNVTRLYRTGDLVRQKSDGTIQFVGRLDHQVKIRGYRIELGEIERVLVEGEDVQEALVVAYTNQDDDKNLAAYLITQEGQTPDVDALRSHLRSKLPGYMVPAAFIELDAWPLTPNGKIDRKQLPAHSKTRQTKRTLAIAANQTEQTVVDIWKRLLKLDEVGVDDNFFDLGGYSLQIARMRDELAQHFSKRLSLADIFARPNVRSLASLLSDDRERKPDFRNQRSRAEKQRQALGRFRRPQAPSRSARG